MHYKEAGVDVGKNSAIKSKIRSIAKGASTPQVIHGVGLFGGLFDASAFKQMKSPVLVASTDGVGTKLKIAKMMKRWDSVGIDLVNHCIDDICAMGARPLFFLDYVAAERLDPSVTLDIVKGVSNACKDAGIALLGGESAEMPGVYITGEYDLAGTIVGVVEHDLIVDGSSIREGDVIIGLPSNGLHTNGYSLARKVLLEKAGMDLHTIPSGWKESIGEVLLKPHVNYFPLVYPLVEKKILNGIAHITGGGFSENIPRVLPSGLGARIDTNTWSPFPIFKLIEKQGDIDSHECYRTFNMGIGIVLFVSPMHAKEVINQTAGAIRIGTVISGSGVEYV